MCLASGTVALHIPGTLMRFNANDFSNRGCDRDSLSVRCFVPDFKQEAREIEPKRIPVRDDYTSTMYFVYNHSLSIPYKEVYRDGMRFV